MASAGHKTRNRRPKNRPLKIKKNHALENWPGALLLKRFGMIWETAEINCNSMGTCLDIGRYSKKIRTTSEVRRDADNYTGRCIPHVRFHEPQNGLVK